MDFKMKIPKTAVPWIIGAGVVICGATAGVITWMNSQNNPVITTEKTVVLSVLDEISIVEGKKTQDVMIINPADNSYDLIVRFLDEDGKVIYTSDRLKPGSLESSITLSRQVREEESIVTVVYDCYDGDLISESIQVETGILVQ